MSLVCTAWVTLHVLAGCAPKSNSIAPQLKFADPRVQTTLQSTSFTAQTITTPLSSSGTKPEDDSDTITIVMAVLFMVLLVLFGSLLSLILIIVVVIERRRAQQSNKKNR